MKLTRIALALITTGCFISAGCSLDANLLDPGDAITSYALANYTGETDFHLDSRYALPQSAIHLFTLQSQGIGESSPTKIYALYLGDTAKIASDTVIVYTHGYSHHMDFYYPRVQLLANVGGKNRYGVMMIDYRGFGLSEGEPTEEGLYADEDAAVQWLEAHGVTADRLIVYGFSLGSGPATYTAAHPRTLRPQKILLESPFASPETLAQDATVIAIPGSFVTNLKFENSEEIKQVTQPLFWVHGIADQFIKMETNGEVVYRNSAATYKEAHRIPGADHGTIPQTWGFRNYADSVLRFLTH